MDVTISNVKWEKKAAGCALLSERELPVLLAIPFTWHAGNSVLLEGMQGENGSKRRRTGKEMGEKDKLVSALGRARPEQLSRAGCNHHEGSRGRQPRLSPFRNRKCCPQPRFSLCGTNPSLHQKPPSLPTEVLWRIFEAGENHQQQQRDEAPREKKNNTTKASRSLLLPEVISMLPGAQPPPPAALEQGRGSRGTHGCWLWAATSCTPARAAPAACAPGNWRKGAGAPGDGAGTSPRCSLLNDWLEARQTDRSIKM